MEQAEARDLEELIRQRARELYGDTGQGNPFTVVDRVLGTAANPIRARVEVQFAEPLVQVERDQIEIAGHMSVVEQESAVIFSTSTEGHRSRFAEILMFCLVAMRQFGNVDEIYAKPLVISC